MLEPAKLLPVEATDPAPLVAPLSESLKVWPPETRQGKEKQGAVPGPPKSRLPELKLSQQGAAAEPDPPEPLPPKPQATKSYQRWECWALTLLALGMALPDMQVRAPAPCPGGVKIKCRQPEVKALTPKTAHASWPEPPEARTHEARLLVAGVLLPEGEPPGAKLSPDVLPPNALPPEPKAGFEPEMSESKPPEPGQTEPAPSQHVPSELASEAGQPDPALFKPALAQPNQSKPPDGKSPEAEPSRAA